MTGTEVMTRSPAWSSVKGVGAAGWTQLDLLNWADTNGLGGASRIIRRIGEYESLRSSVFSGALDIIAQDIGKVRGTLVRETKSSVSVLEPREHQWAKRLALKPNRHQTWSAFWLQAIPELVKRQELLTYRRRRTRTDTAPDLISLSAQEWTQNSDGERYFYDVSAGTTGRQAMLGFGSATLTEDDVIHVVMRSLNGYEGLSTLTIGSDVLGLNAMLVDFHAALVKGGTRPTGVIQVPGELGDEAFNRLKGQILELMREAAEKGTPLVLEQDSKWESIGLDADQTDLVRARELMALECARLLRMPPYKLGMTSDLNKSNLEVMEKAYVDDTLVPICEAVEQAMTFALLTEEECLDGIRFRFDREQLYDRDPAARRERIETQFKAGVLFLNEARTKLGYTPVPDDQDHRSLPVNTAQVFRDGRVQIFTSQTGPRNDANDTAPADPDASGQQRGLRLVASNT